MKTLLILFALCWPNIMGQTVTHIDGTKGVVVRQYNTEVKVRTRCNMYEYWTYEQLRK